MYPVFKLEMHIATEFSHGLDSCTKTTPAMLGSKTESKFLQSRLWIVNSELLQSTNNPKFEMYIYIYILNIYININYIHV